MREKIFVNQVGYITKLNKSAVVVGNAIAFSVIEKKSGKTVLFKKLTLAKYDIASGDDAKIADFSEVQKAGEYYIKAGTKKSEVFEISDKPYAKLKDSLLKTLYYNRCGKDLSSGYIGEYAHKACHTYSVSDIGSRGKFNLAGGWHEGGNYGRYTGSTCIALAHMLYAYKLFPKAYENYDHPDKENEMPNILTESKHGLEWLLKMQDSKGGVYHKLTSDRHCAMIMPQDEKQKYFVFPPSHTATANTCAVFALAASIYRDFDAKFADKLIAASLNAWEWLSSNPKFIPFSNPDNIDSADGIDMDFRDNKLWALCELYSLTGEQEINKQIALEYPPVNTTKFAWDNVGGFAAIAYLFSDKEKDIYIQDAMKTAFIYEADSFTSMSLNSRYGTAMAGNRFFVDSNAKVMTNAMTLIVANIIYHDKAYVDAAINQLNYILGKNPMGISYVTGFGKNHAKNPHHRMSVADNIDKPISGLIVGGPDMLRSDECVKWMIPSETPPAKCYVDSEYSFATNEPKLCCTAAAVFVAGYFDGGYDCNNYTEQSL